jgi:hypothetical protein
VPKRRQVVVDCTFCGDAGVPSAREDVFPRWLAEKLAYFARQHHPGTDARYVDYTYERLADLGTENTSAERETGAVPTAFHLPDVCRECNGGWMGRLEEAAKLVIVGLIEGKPKMLAPYDQFVLGMWVVKTSLTYDAARGTRLVPEAFGTREFFRLGRPLPGAYVAIGHDPNHTPDGSLVHARQEINGGRLAAREGVTRDAHAVRFAFQFDHLILKSIINYGEDLLADGVRQALLQPDPPHFNFVFPPVPRYVWPSTAALVTRNS